MKDRSFDDFEGYADHYRELHSKNMRYMGADSFYFIHHKISLLQLFESNKKLHLLDLGCGDGMTAYFLEKSFPDFEIKGIMALEECWIGEDCSIPDMMRFARLIEERHGIK